MSPSNLTRGIFLSTMVRHMQEQENEFVPEEEAEQGPALIKKLREKLKKAIEEKQEYLDGWQRSRADFANFKKEEATRETEKETSAKAPLSKPFSLCLTRLKWLSNKPKPKSSIFCTNKFSMPCAQWGQGPLVSRGSALTPTNTRPCGKFRQKRPKKTI